MSQTTTVRMNRCGEKCTKCYLPCVLINGLSTHEHDAYTKTHFHWVQKKKSFFQEDALSRSAHQWETEYSLAGPDSLPVPPCPSCVSEHLGKQYLAGDCPIHNIASPIKKIRSKVITRWQHCDKCQTTYLQMQNAEGKWIGHCVCEFIVAIRERGT